MTLDRASVLAFRVRAHHLAKRLPRGSFVDAAAVSGVRTMPKGSALRAFRARITSANEAELEGARKKGVLVEVLSVRGNPVLVPARDAAMFTLGAVPRDEQSLLHALRPARHLFGETGTSAQDALARTREAAWDALSSGPLAWSALAAELTRRLPELSPPCRGRCPDPHIEEGLFRLAAVSGAWFLSPEDDRLCVRMDELPEWRDLTPDVARAELVRRYLACHGPSTAAQFAEWAGISPADARASFTALEHELTEVGRAALLTRDAARLKGARPVTGVRLLGPSDPYLMSRDRETLVPDAAARKRLWRAMAGPGAVLVDGRIAGAWRKKKSARRLVVVVDPFEEMSAAKLEAEANGLANEVGCSSAELVFDPT